MNSRSNMTLDRFRAGSVPYPEMGAVLRLVIGRAIKSRLNGTEWRVLAAVTSLTATWSKYYDSTYVARVAELADVDRKDPTLKRTKRALRRLSELHLIVYEPAQKDGQRTVLGLAGESAIPTGSRSQL